MNLLELERSLPNGLHDATLLRLAVDYVERTVVLEVEIWVDGPDVLLELYRPARITLRGLVYFVIEPPNARYPFREPGGVTIDLSVMEMPVVAGCENEAAFRLFVYEHNSFIQAAAPEAVIEWLGPAAPRNGGRVRAVTESPAV